MTQAEQETIEAFKREFALALRRITGYQIDLFPEELPTEVTSGENTEVCSEIIQL